MTPARKTRKSAARPAWLGALPSILRDPAGPFVWAGVLVATLLGAWYLVWLRVGDRVLASDDYLLSAEHVEITPLPGWIHTDVRSDVLKSIRFDGPLSIMDPQLTERVANAFSSNPWVAKVVQVRKYAPARVKVDLVYRRPVCMVEAAGDLWPVDVHGVLLPYGNDDFSPVERNRYPRLVGIDTGPVRAVGECWGDGRVVGGAEIAAALADVWDQLDLQQIAPSAPLATGVAEEPTYTLVTRKGTRIFWGRAPGTDVPGELSAADKVARLCEYRRQHGTLDGAGGPQRLDVHRLGALPDRLRRRPKPGGNYD